MIWWAISSRQKSITDAVTSANNQSFTYDSLQRLSQGQGVYGSYAYTYDQDGNRLTETHGSTTTTYGYGTGNDLLATLTVSGITTQTIGYTADGRINSLSPGMEAPGGQYITSLSYNQAAQLAAVNAGSSALTGYTYDGFGQRLLKTISSTDGNIYQYGQNGMLLEETDQSGAAQADYIYLNGRPIADLAPSSGTLYYLHDDMLGTPQLASDSSQNIQWQASYGPFGQTSSVSGTITQNLRLPGQDFDSESGWNHNGFRNYIPDLGRYIEPDPLAQQGTSIFYDPTTGQLTQWRRIWLPGGVSYYAYVLNNPINFIDPLGLKCTCTYHQSTGAIQCVDNKTGKVVAQGVGYSGIGKGLNNPSMEGIEDVGPLPRGEYSIGSATHEKGPLTLPLNPLPGTDLLGRSGGFLIHGDNRKMNHTASHGCIIQNRNVRQAIANCGGGTVNVE